MKRWHWLVLALLSAVLLVGCTQRVTGTVDDFCYETGYVHLEDGRSVLVYSCLFMEVGDSVIMHKAWDEKWWRVDRNLAWRISPDGRRFLVMKPSI